MTLILNDQFFMRQALAEAKIASEKGEVPVGAVVVCQGMIIARSHNLTQTLNDVTAHAEMQAITAASNVLGGKYLINCTMYVTLEPCPMCAGALLWSQISKVVCGARDEKRGFKLYSPLLLHPKTEFTSGILAEECSSILSDFFKKNR